MGIVVICSYKPKDGKESELMDLVKKHQPALRAEGLITHRAPIFMKSAEGLILEIFEWVSEDAAKGAHANAKVGPIWDAMAAVADFVPLSSAEQTKTPFAHFEPFDL